MSIYSVFREKGISHQQKPNLWMTKTERRDPEMPCPLTHVLEPLVLLLLTSTSQQRTEMFSVTFWTSVTGTRYCSPATFCPNLPVCTDHLEKTLLVQSNGSAQSLHPQTLSQADSPNPLPQPRGSRSHWFFWVWGFFGFSS